MRKTNYLDNNISNQNRNQNNSQNNNNMGNNFGRGQNRKSMVLCLLVALGIFLVFSLMNRQVEKARDKEISYDQFLQLLDDGQVESVTLTSDQIKIVPKKQSNSLYQITYHTGLISMDITLVQRLEKANVKFTKKSDSSNSMVYMLVSTVLPFLLLWVGLIFMSRVISKNSGGIMGVGKSTAKMYVQKETGVTFRDVAGQEEAMDSLNELVDFLHNPKKYTEIGAKLPKGALLVGPPGTGKTLLAKAVAGEAGVPFFSISGSDFVEMFVGVGASRVRDLFEEAKKNAPCIVFIDEIDAIGKSRDSRYGGGNDEREQTLNQLLAEMDGFDTSKGLLILAATNRPEVLDPALLRPGRFDRRIIVDRPDLKGRVEILKVHAKNVMLDETVDLDAIALATSGASGADLANIVNEAALRAVRMNRRVINQEDLFESVEVIIAGQQRKNHIMSRDEREIVAFHEIGHALVAAKQKNTQPIQKITIIPRTSGALGYTMQMPEEERFLMKKSEMLEELVTLLGGRAAEEVQFGNITTGASNDIEKATDLARKMVTMYGMSDEFGMMGLELPGSQYMDGRPVKTCADETMVKADEIVRQILEKAYQQAVAILRENQIILQKSAGFLLDKETITGQEFMEFIQGTEDESPVPLTE